MQYNRIRLLTDYFRECLLQDKQQGKNMQEACSNLFRVAYISGPTKSNSELCLKVVKRAALQAGVTGIQWGDKLNEETN